MIIRASLLVLMAVALWGSLETPAAAQTRDPAEAARVAAVTQPIADFSKAEPFENRSAGAATAFVRETRNAFSQPSANMAFERELQFKVGNGIFKKLWVTAPASTQSSEGLGPLYNGRACQRCHLKDGRGHPPAPGEKAISIFLRLSIPPSSTDEWVSLATFRRSVIPEPTYGGQLQTFAVPGLSAEAELNIAYVEEAIALAGGETVSLRHPTYRMENLGYGPLHPATMTSPRVAPPMIGLGLLEAIPAGDILALADPDDTDGDGISGRPNWSWSHEHDRLMLGRFGRKAGEPTIRQQSAGAFRGDIGIASPLFPEPHGDCMPAQKPCMEAPGGGNPEVAAGMMDAVLFYSRNLAVPARRNVDGPGVLRGKKLFYETGCIACHRPKFVTARDAAEPEQRFQLIWPYTDLLLHDMGPGLADQRPEGAANGREWRTPPLWGIGLTKAVNDHTLFLHDGRARNLLEAILWHGGEAEVTRSRVVEMTRAERRDLIAFLNSL